MTAEEFFRKTYCPKVCDEDYELGEELGLIKKPDFSFAEAYHKAKVEETQKQKEKECETCGCQRYDFCNGFKNATEQLLK